MWDLKPFETENISKIRDVLMDNHLEIYATQNKIGESLLRGEVQLGSDVSEVVHSLSYSLDVKCKTNNLSVLRQFFGPQSHHALKLQCQTHSD